jgi:hypothetical protein
LSASSSTNSATTVRTAAEPFSFVQLQLYHVALTVTHYAVTLPPTEPAAACHFVRGGGIDSWSTEDDERAEKAAALFGSPKRVRPQARDGSSSVSSAAVAAGAVSSSLSGPYLRSWRLEGSNTGLHWTVLHECEDDSESFRPRADGAARRVLFAVDHPPAAAGRSSRPLQSQHQQQPPQQHQRFSLFRLTQTGPDSHGSHALCVAGLELYGCLRACISDAGFLLHEERAAQAALRASLLQRASDIAAASAASFVAAPVPRASFLPNKPPLGLDMRLGATFTIPLDEQGSGVTPGLEVPLSERGRVVINKGSARWRAIRVEQPLRLWTRQEVAALASTGDGSSSVDAAFVSGRRRFYRCSFLVLSSPPTSNSWRLCVGVVSSRFDFDLRLSARCWIGAQPRSWGYIAGTGGRCNDSGTSVEYGAAWGAGDRVTLCVDLALGHVSFSLNGVDQGVAFTNLRNDNDEQEHVLYPAVSVHAVRAQIKFLPHDDEDDA